jgi:hypothetical protein
MCATFQHVDASHLQHWTDEDQVILREATSWFKLMAEGGVDAGIDMIRTSPFHIHIQWISDLFYDRYYSYLTNFSAAMVLSCQLTIAVLGYRCIDSCGWDSLQLGPEPFLAVRMA